jgi:serine/threonine protein kinase
MSADGADVKSLFGQAMALPPQQRAAFLQERCQDDPGLRAEVESLLAAYQEAASFLGELLPASVAEKAVRERPGTAVGPYRLLRLIGEGGFGVVFLAEQEQRVLSLADADPWRQRLRAAREREDRQALERLAREVDVASRPPEALLLLAAALRRCGARETTVALLRRAHEVHPGDFWITHDLGRALADCQPPDNEAASRFLKAAAP